MFGRPVFKAGVTESVACLDAVLQHLLWWAHARQRAAFVMRNGRLALRGALFAKVRD